MTNAVIYLRISQDRTGLQAGVTRQREDCERRCRERGWDVVAVETDNDVSATKGRKRPGFEAMLHAVDTGKADVIVAWAMDRLQRSRRDELRLYETCTERTATLSLVNGTDLDFSSAAGRFVADSLGSVARLEVEMKSDRQRRAQEQAAAAGKRVGGRRPFGFEPDGVTVRDDEAEAIRAGYEAVMLGVPLAQIAREWNAAGHRTGQKAWKGDRRGQDSPWRPDAVRLVLLNPRYAGKRAYRGEVVADAEWPALVSEERWQAVHATLSDPARRTGPRNKPRALLSGLALCAVCGEPVQSGGAARPGIRGYRCGASTGHFARKAEPVDEFVSQVVVERLSRPDAIDLMVDEDTPDLDALRATAVDLRARLDSLAVDFADGSLTASQVRTATKRVQDRLGEVEGQMADAGRVDVLGDLVGAEDVEAKWDGLPVSRKRAVVDALMTVRLHPVGRGVRTFRPETVTVEWRS